MAWKIQRDMAERGHSLASIKVGEDSVMRDAPGILSHCPLASPRPRVTAGLAGP
jgi:hypothetical protein